MKRFATIALSVAVSAIMLTPAFARTTDPDDVNRNTRMRQVTVPTENLKRRANMGRKLMRPNTVANTSQASSSSKRTRLDRAMLRQQKVENILRKRVAKPKPRASSSSSVSSVN